MELRDWKMGVMEWNRDQSSGMEFELGRDYEDWKQVLVHVAN